MVLMLTDKILHRTTQTDIFSTSRRNLALVRAFGYAIGDIEPDVEPVSPQHKAKESELALVSPRPEAKEYWDDESPDVNLLKRLADARKDRERTVPTRIQ
jgi:hypothetical protein